MKKAVWIAAALIAIVGCSTLGLVYAGGNLGANDLGTGSLDLNKMTLPILGGVVGLGVSLAKTFNFYACVITGVTGGLMVEIVHRATLLY